MSLIVLSDVVLTEDLMAAAGARGKQVRRNSRVVTQDGTQRANIVWDATLREYEIGFIPMQRGSWAEIETLHEVTEGGAYGFLMEDPKDSTVELGRFASLTSTTFQLYKRYLHAGSSRTKDRKITRPRSVDGTLTISGVAKTLGVDYTVDDETGIFTIPSAPSAANLAWTGPFYVPVHFRDDSIDWELVRPGEDARLLAGPTLVLQEVRE
jgi:uncharacterized protein (TIGR02217 family)